MLPFHELLIHLLHSVPDAAQATPSITLDRIRFGDGPVTKEAWLLTRHRELAALTQIKSDAVR